MLVRGAWCVMRDAWCGSGRGRPRSTREEAKRWDELRCGGRRQLGARGRLGTGQQTQQAWTGMFLRLWCGAAVMVEGGAASL